MPKRSRPPLAGGYVSYDEAIDIVMSIMTPMEIEHMAPRTSNMGTTVDLDAEESIGTVGTQGKVVPAKSTRKTGGSRPSYEDAPHCPHCEGRMHMNLPIGTVNHECLWRQFNVSTGVVPGPDASMPPYMATDARPLADWIESRMRSRKAPLIYGKMASAGGAPSTYAAARAASKSIADVASDVEVTPKRGRKTAGSVLPVPAANTGKRGVTSKAVVGKPVDAEASKSRTRRAAAPVSTAAPTPGFSFADSDEFGEADEATAAPAPARRTRGTKVIESPVITANEAKKRRPVLAQRPDPKAAPRHTAGAQSAKATPPVSAKSSSKRAAAMAKAASGR